MESRHLVIDASIARSSGGPQAVAFSAKQSRDLLTSIIEDTNHRLVLSPEIRKEWRNHASDSARGWLRDMTVKDRIRVLSQTESDALKQAIREYAPQPSVADIMQKDRLLIEAALETDLRIVSADDRVRGHFSRGAKAIDALRALLWSNPHTPEEECIEWVVAGAPRTTDKLLYTYA